MRSPTREQRDDRWSTPVLAGLVLAIAVLAVLALRVLPRRAAAPARGSRLPAPRPPVAGISAALTTVAFLVPLVPLEPAPGGRGPWMLVPMAVAAGIAVGAAWLLRRWAPGLTDRHRVFLAGGALASHTLIGRRSSPRQGSTGWCSPPWPCSRWSCWPGSRAP